MTNNDDVLTAGLRWLFDTQQPPGAVLSHHGESLRGDGNRLFRFIPSGWDSHVVLVVDVAEVQWWAGRPTNPLGPTELEDLAAWLTAHGLNVVNTWNGHPGITGSVAVAGQPHPTLLAAVDRYLNGCPDHDHSSLCRCGWYAAGNRLVVRPEARATA